MSVKKFSDEWGIPQKTVRDWIRRGKIPSIRYNGKRLIDLDAVEASIADNGDVAEGV